MEGKWVLISFRLCSSWELRAQRAVPGPSSLLSQVPRLTSLTSETASVSLLCCCLAPARCPSSGPE